MIYICEDCLAPVMRPLKVTMDDMTVKIFCDPCFGTFIKELREEIDAKAKATIDDFENGSLL